MDITSLAGAAAFAVAFASFYAAHHVGDYWVQTDHQAQHKGDPNRTGAGRLACLSHVLTYVITQAVFLSFAILATGLPVSLLGANLALVISGATHYWADRRWTLEWLAGLIPGKIGFYRLGTPRKLKLVAASTEQDRHADWAPLDNPTLGTGAWALDQSFHILFSVFAPALILAWAV
jgi:hypothetical protein